MQKVNRHSTFLLTTESIQSQTAINRFFFFHQVFFVLRLILTNHWFSTTIESQLNSILKITAKKNFCTHFSLEIKEMTGSAHFEWAPSFLIFNLFSFFFGH